MNLRQKIKQYSLAFLIGGSFTFSLSCGSTDINKTFADVNNDGRADIIYVGNSKRACSTDFAFYMMKAEKDGSYSKSEELFIVEDKPTDMHFADVNGDGNLDLIYSVVSGQDCGTAVTYAALGKGNGKFEKPKKIKVWK